jgi:general secretion pathway protein G
VRPGALVPDMRRGAALLLVSLAALGYAGSRMYEVQQDRHREAGRPAALKDSLFQMRKAIDNFRERNGRYPHSLDELVPNYLRSIPVDPFTESTRTWRVTTEETVVPAADFTTATAAQPETYVIDVHSGAGAPYSDW